MKRVIGKRGGPDDEWYTPHETASRVAAWAARELELDTPILCPADILPDGTESTIPVALRDAGFTAVRVTRDLPLGPLFADWRGEVVITNPPFSLLVPFRNWLEYCGARFIVLSRPGGLRRCYTIPEMGASFFSDSDSGVAAAWFQNIRDTRPGNITGAPLGNCRTCERDKCPKNCMTARLAPGQDRPLYGWRVVVRNGIAGWHCHEYLAGGGHAFTRFFNPPFPAGERRARRQEGGG